MNLRTEIEVFPFDKQINFNSSILTFGSCFADNIASYLINRKFDVLANPFGVLFNPVSINNSINHLLNKTVFSEHDLVENQSEWHSFSHHSDFSHHEKENCINNINAERVNTSRFLERSNWIFITYGTSFVYKIKDTNHVVSNCHKFPQEKFERSLLSDKELFSSADSTVKRLTKLNPDIQILFTVSPIRHWKDGAVDNQLSKSKLIVAVNKIVSANTNCHYFPSYEIIMDDLRDYRFYEADMLHPNKIATDYIWQKFRDALIEPDCYSIMQSLEKIHLARYHRVRNPKSSSHRKFVLKQLELIKELINKLPSVNLEEERKYFQSFLD
jgi:hypothetical protein